MEAMRQVIGAIYIAFCEAAGGDAVLRRANAVLQEVLDEDAVDDPIAIRVLETLLEAATSEMDDVVRIAAPGLDTRIFAALASPALH